jgi:hypothetical protein
MASAVTFSKNAGTLYKKGRVSRPKVVLRYHQVAAFYICGGGRSPSRFRTERGGAVGREDFIAYDSLMSN